MQQKEVAWVDEVLRFWFEETAPESWFRKDNAFDQVVRVRFLDVYENVAAAPVEDLTKNPRTALAAAIVLDQFPRNMFRGSPRAFATDAKALALAEAAIARGLDQQLKQSERLFLYLPFEHCEDAAVQARCVSLVAALEDPELARYAQAHKDIIDRFGRFPHRNAILGRVSTPEELEFLEQPGSSF